MKKEEDKVCVPPPPPLYPYPYPNPPMLGERERNILRRSQHSPHKKRLYLTSFFGTC